MTDPARLPARLPVPDAITGPRIIAIARGLEPDRLARIADGLLAGGVHAFEVTLDSPGALPARTEASALATPTPLSLCV